MRGFAGGRLDAPLDTDPVWWGDEIAVHGEDTTRWTDGTRFGVIDGAITTLPELGWSLDELFGRFSAAPAETARALDGDFAIAFRDPTTDRHLLVTDKLGTRPLFYTTEPFRYASAVGPLAATRSTTLDRQAVADMLLMGHLWGTNTLVEEVSAVYPATVVAFDGDRPTTTRYWTPDYTEATPGSAYVRELVDRYRTAIRRTARTLPDRPGLWLSGGLDSRTTASALLATDTVDSLATYTYDANPPTNDNPRLAARVADRLGTDHQTIPLDADTVGRQFDRVIEATDGTLSWVFATNLAATAAIPDPPSVVMEGTQGELLGDHLYRHHLSMPPVASQRDSEASVSPDRVRETLAVPVDPLASFEREARRSSEPTDRRTVLDVHFRNYYNRLSTPSNRVARRFVDTRVPHADGAYLDWCASLPRRYRKGAARPPDAVPVPFVPYEPTRAKLALTRRVAPETTDLTYERTKLPPSWPYHAHVVGFVTNVVVDRLRGRPTYGAGQLADAWIRDPETAIHDRVDRLVRDACERPVFDGDAVRRWYDDHLAGANNASILGRITTVERWAQAHVDRSTRTSVS